jgi:hypothetical protein
MRATFSIMLTVLLSGLHFIPQSDLKAADPSPPEISGIIIHKDVEQEGSPEIFSVVSNSVAGSYYKNFLSHLPEPGNAKEFPTEALRTKLAPHLERQASDLEDVGIFAGEVVVLSENTASLIGSDRVVVDFSAIPELNEANGRYGLEGLAIRKIKGNKERVAVLWEGGWEPASAPPRKPRSPRVFILDVEAAAISTGPVRPTKNDGTYFKLDYDTLLKLTGEQYPTPFRAPAMVWTKLGDGKWGLIVLISVDQSGNYHKKWLVRFDESGKEAGYAHTLTSLGMPDSVKGRNWEGMCWNSDFTRLHLVDDVPSEQFGQVRTMLCTIRPPKEW